jgi:hypothetical protein
MTEVGSCGKRAPVDAGFDFAFKEGFRAELCVPAKTSLQSLDGCFDCRIGGVNASGAQKLHGEEGWQPIVSVGAVPGSIGTLVGKNFGGNAFVWEAGALESEGGRGAVGEIAQGLPTDGRIGVKDPGDGVHREILREQVEGE